MSCLLLTTGWSSVCAFLCLQSSPYGWGTSQSCKWGVWIWWDLEGSFLALHSVPLSTHVFHSLKWGSHQSQQLGREICLPEDLFSRMQDPSGPSGTCVSPDASVPACSIGGLNWGRGLGLVHAVLLGDKVKTLTTLGPQSCNWSSDFFSFLLAQVGRGAVWVGEEAL